MTALPMKQFTGEFPRINPHDLSPNAAQFAENCDFTQGNLTGIKSRVAVPGVNAPGAKSIFVYDGLTFSYYSWPRDVDAVRSPIASDAYARFYWADGTNFWVSRGDLGGQGAEPSSTNRFKVGVPQPESSLSQLPVDNSFTINGVRPVLYEAYWEGSNGTSKPHVALNGTFTEDTVNSATINAPLPANIGAKPNESGVTYELVVVVRFNLGSGFAQMILRPDPNKSTIPTEYDGVSASYTLSSNVITVNLRTRADYKEARAYTYTYVNQYGEEGPPANPLFVDTIEGQTIKLRYTPPPTGTYVPMTRVRVYRTATGSASTEYLFVGEVVVNNSNPQFVDDVKGDALGESIFSRDFYPPPQTLRGICALPCGVLVGFKDNEIWFSEPYLPYAWKPSNTQTVQNKVIGLCPYENGVYVTTTAHPVLISGVNPGYMTAQKIPAVQAGVSKGSICNVGPFVAYASHDGIVTIRGLDASLDMSFKFFTRDVWRARYANKLPLMRLNAHDGHLLVWFTDGTPGFLVKLDENAPSMTEVTDPVYSAIVFPQSDALYVGAGNSLYEFKGGLDRLNWKFWSKDHVLPRPENLGCLQVVGGGMVTLTVYADGNEVFRKEDQLLDQFGSTVIRLPAGFKSRRWSFKIEGGVNSFVYEMTPAVSPSELANV